MSERSSVTADADFLATGIEVRCCRDDDGQPLVLIYTENYDCAELDGRPVLDVVLNDGAIWEQSQDSDAPRWGEGKPHVCSPTSELSRVQHAIVEALAIQYGSTEILPLGNTGHNTVPVVLARGIASEPVYDATMVVSGPLQDGPWWFVADLPRRLRRATDMEIERAQHASERRTLLAAAGLTSDVYDGGSSDG